jgi:hypothetical protein
MIDKEMCFIIVPLNKVLSDERWIKSALREESLDIGNCESKSNGQMQASQRYFWSASGREQKLPSSPAAQNEFVHKQQLQNDLDRRSVPD